MEESLKNRGFLAERRFKNIISPFVEMVEKREEKEKEEQMKLKQIS